MRPWEPGLPLPFALVTVDSSSESLAVASPSLRLRFLVAVGAVADRRHQVQVVGAHRPLAPHIGRLRTSAACTSGAHRPLAPSAHIGRLQRTCTLVPFRNQRSSASKTFNCSHCSLVLIVARDLESSSSRRWFSSSRVCIEMRRNLERALDQSPDCCTGNARNFKMDARNFKKHLDASFVSLLKICILYFPQWHCGTTPNNAREFSAMNTRRKSIDQLQKVVEQQRTLFRIYQSIPATTCQQANSCQNHSQIEKKIRHLNFFNFEVEKFEDWKFSTRIRQSPSQMEVSKYLPTSSGTFRRRTRVLPVLLLFLQIFANFCNFYRIWPSIVCWIVTGNSHVSDIAKQNRFDDVFALLL